MPLMTSIRNNLSKAFAVFAGVFIVYIVLDWGMDLTGRKGRQGTGEVVGSINGREIIYREFSDAVRRTTEAQKKQTGADIDDETERQIRSQVWNSMVDQILFEQEIKRLGIAVTDQEIIDWVQGPNPPEMLVNQFKDSTGTFRRDAYYQAMRDPQNKQAWLQVEEFLRNQRRQEKLQSLLLSSIRVSDPEVRQRYLDKNLAMDAEYVLFDVNRLVPDSQVTVTDDDLKSYFNSHQEEFKVKAARRLKYVFFSQGASSEDSAATFNDISHFREQLKAGMDFVDLAKTYSENPVSEAFFKHGELSKIKEDAVFSARKGDVVGPIVDVDGYHLIKILDEKQGTVEFVKASHILLNTVVGPDSVKVIQKARDLARQARGGANFAELARKNSQDYGSAVSGGELGWTAKGGWVKPFEQAAFNAKVGDIVGPVRTQFGWHIIKLTGKDKREVKIADLVLKIKASTKTTDEALRQGQDFVYLAKDEGFEKSAEVSHYEILQTPEFSKGSFVPGIGMNDAVMSFAFTKKLGAISDPVAITNGIGVFKISEVREDGIRPFDDAKAFIRVPVLKAKKLEKIKAIVDKFYATLTPSTELLAAAGQIPNVTATRTGRFTPMDAVSGVGRDPKFIGEAMVLKAGEISKPFDGSRGYYIMKLISKAAFDTARYNAERSTLRDQILQDKKSRLISDWLTTLREKADIEDHRDKFYR
jgi:peptidyl-prolyl cis-trans isomerase D